MFRRARLNVRPNVRPAGRGAGSAADPKPQGSDSPVTASAEGAAGEATEPPPIAPEVESDNKTDGSNDAGEASKPAEAPMQRRKRISTMPNLAKPRAAPSSAHNPASKPQRRASQAPDDSASQQKEPSPPEKSHAESPLKAPVLPEKKTPVPQVPQFSPLKRSVSKEPTACAAAQKNEDVLQKTVPAPLKERPTQEISGTQEEKLPAKPSPVKEKRMCSDRERILKARKLREMLKEELKKERMLKHRPPVIEGRSPPDHSKMTMRDLIYYLPENNPMKSSLAEEKRTERSSAPSQMKEQQEKSAPDREEDDENEEAENDEESQDGPLLVPRVKVAEDGSIILDEESLTVEVLRTKGPCVVEENDPIFERGSTTTYSSFRKSFYTKPWSNKETDMFFLAISMVGTDFSLIGRLFPHRARAEIKNKFKREEKANGWRIDKAFKEKRPFDFEFFAQLLEKVLAEEEKRKQKTVKSQKPKEKKPSRPRKKLKAAKSTNTEAADEQSDLQEARISDAEADAVMAEKENEESLGISEEAGEQIASEPALAKRKRKRKRKGDPEEEVENLSDEMAVPSKIADKGKSSKKTAGRKVVCDASNDDHTACGEEMYSVMEGKQGETAVTEEERSGSCLPVDHRMERESDVNLCSFEGGSDVMLEMDSAKPRAQGARVEALQGSQNSELPVTEARSPERQPEETNETKNEVVQELHRPEENQSAEESDSQSGIMRTRRRELQAPQCSSERSTRKKKGPQEKMETETSPPGKADEKSSEEVRGKGDEGTAREAVDSKNKSQDAEGAVAAKTPGRGRRQKFKPNISGASEKKEESGKESGGDEVAHPTPKKRARKNTQPSKSPDPAGEESSGKDDIGQEKVSEDAEGAVAAKTPGRGRRQKVEPNISGASEKKEESGKESGGDEVAHPTPKKRAKKNTQPSKSPDPAGEESSGKDDIGQEKVSEDAEGAVAAKTPGRGRRQKVEPNISGASEKKEESGKESGGDEVAHPTPKKRAKKKTQPSKSSDPAGEESSGKDDIGQEKVSEITGKGTNRGQLEKPIPYTLRSPRRRIEGPQEKMETETSPAGKADEKSSEEVRGKGDEGTAREAVDSKNKSQITGKGTNRGQLEKPIPYTLRSPRRRIEGPQEKMETETSPAGKADEKSSEEVRGKGDEGTAREAVDSKNKSQDAEGAVAAKTPGRGRRQKFKPNISGASARKEESGKESGGDEVAHPTPKKRAKKKTQPSKSSDPAGEEFSGKDDIGQEKVSEPNERAKTREEDSKKSVLKPAPLKRGRVLRSTRNLPQTDAEKEDLMGEKDPEEEKTAGDQAEEVVIDQKDDNNDPLPRTDVVPHEGAQPSSEILEEDVFPDSEMNTEQKRQSSQEKSAEPEGHEIENELSDVLKKVSEMKIGKSYPQKEQGETVLPSAFWFLKTQFHTPEPNLTATGKEELKAKSEAALCPAAELLSKEEKEQQEVPQVPHISGKIRCEQSSDEKSTSQEGKLSALKPEQLIRHESVTASPDVKAAVEEVAASLEEEAKKGENLPVGQESEGPLPSKDNSEASFEGKSAERDNLDTTPKSMKSEALPPPEKSFHCYRMCEQGELTSTDDTESTEDTTESDTSISQVEHEESDESDTRPMQKVMKTIHWGPRPNLMGVTGKGDPKEGENSREDSAENRCLMLQEPAASSVSAFSQAARKRSSMEPAETPSKRSRQSPLELSPASSRKETYEEYHSSKPKVNWKPQSSSRRLMKHLAQQRYLLERGNADSSDSEEEKSQTQEVKPFTAGRRLATARRHVKRRRISQPTLVTFQAAQKKEEGNDTNSDESEYFTPKEPSKASAFLPVGLGSPKPLAVQTEKTLEEGEMPGNVPAVQVAHDAESHVPETAQTKEQKQHKESPSTAMETTVQEDPEVNKGVKDGSTKAALTSHAMGGPKIELKIRPEGASPKGESIVNVEDESSDSSKGEGIINVEDESSDSSKGGSIINVEDESSEKETGVVECLEEKASETRKEEEMECSSSGELPAESASLTPEKSCLGVEDCPKQSSVAETTEQNPSVAESSASSSNLLQNEDCAQGTQQASMSSSTEAAPVAEDVRKCPEDEQSFLLRLVDITNYSAVLDEAPLLEDIPEEYLPAPIIVRPIKTRGKPENGAKSYLEDKQVESAPSDAPQNLETVPKSGSAEGGRDSSSPAKKTLPAPEGGNVEATYKDYPTVSADSPEGACDYLSKENLLTSLMFDNMALLSDKKYLEALEKLETSPCEKELSNQEVEMVMSGLMCESEAGTSSGQPRQEGAPEAAEVEHTGTVPSTPEPPLTKTGQERLGFLPFMCKRSSFASTEDTKMKGGNTQTPVLVTLKQSPKDLTPSSEGCKESCPLPSASTSRSSSLENEEAAAQAAPTVPTSKPPEEPPLGDEEEKATKVSEYFFSDIFMEVNDPE